MALENMLGMGSFTSTLVFKFLALLEESMEEISLFLNPFVDFVHNKVCFDVAYL